MWETRRRARHRETEFREQARSQTEFGNESAEAPPMQVVARVKSRNILTALFLDGVLSET